MGLGLVSLSLGHLPAFHGFLNQIISCGAATSVVRKYRSDHVPPVAPQGVSKSLGTANAPCTQPLRPLQLPQMPRFPNTPFTLVRSSG